MSSSCFARRGLPFSASFPSSIKISEFKVRNSGELSKSSSSTNSILKEGVRGHDTAKYRRGILNQASSPIPPILRAAKDGNDEDLAEILRKAALFGISPEELNAVDSSGRVSANLFLHKFLLHKIE